MNISKTEIAILGVLLLVLAGVCVWIGSIFSPQIVPSLALNADVTATVTASPKQNVNNAKPVYLCPPCSVQVDSWRFDVKEIRLDPGMDSSRRSAVLIGHIYNLGRVPALFSPLFVMVLKDSDGRIYEVDQNTTFAAENKYGTELFGGGNLNPGSHNYVAYGYDVPASVKTFTISPGESTSSWGSNFTFSVP